MTEIGKQWRRRQPSYPQASPHYWDHNTAKITLIRVRMKTLSLTQPITPLRTSTVVIMDLCANAYIGNFFICRNKITIFYFLGRDLNFTISALIMIYFHQIRVSRPWKFQNRVIKTYLQKYPLNCYIMTKITLLEKS